MPLIREERERERGVLEIDQPDTIQPDGQTDKRTDTRMDTFGKSISPKEEIYDNLLFIRPNSRAMILGSDC